MTDTHEIDKQAQNLFHQSLPPSWLIREQHPDVYVDYFVEIREKSEPSGVIFGVQLKGTGSPRYSKYLIKISMKTKHLAYYFEKVKQPIFLIAVDIRSKKGFWFFIQKWAKEELKNINWIKQKKIDIKIPLKNSLSDMQHFREEIRKAEIFMRDLWPSSIPAAIQYEKESMEATDPRVRVDISYQKGRTIYNLQARETFDFNIQFKGIPHVQDKFTDLLNRGVPATFDTDEIIKMTGSPLLENIFDRGAKGKLVIEPKTKIHTSLTFFTLDSEKQEKIVLYGIEGIILAGKKEARFQGNLKKTPLAIKFIIQLPTSLESNPLAINLNFESSAWQGIPVLRLPHFEKLKDFFISIQQGCILRIVCEIEGNHIFTATSQAIDRRFIEIVSKHLQVIEKVRIIANEINIDPIYPEGGLINEDEIQTIFVLYGLITSGVYRQTGNGLIFRGKLLPNDNFFKMIQRKNSNDFSGTFMIESADQKFKLFGEEFKFHPLRYSLTNPVLVTDLSSLKKDSDVIHRDGIEIVFAGRAESELTISKV